MQLGQFVRLCLPSVEKIFQLDISSDLGMSGLNVREGIIFWGYR